MTEFYQLVHGLVYETLTVNNIKRKLLQQYQQSSENKTGEADKNPSDRQNGAPATSPAVSDNKGEEDKNTATVAGGGDDGILQVYLSFVRDNARVLFRHNGFLSLCHSRPSLWTMIVDKTFEEQGSAACFDAL